MKGWHVTSRRNREGIAASGLRTDVGGWDTKYVWFFIDFDIAQQSARMGAWGGHLGDNDIWEIDLTDLFVRPDPHPGWGSTRPGWDDAARVVTNHIDPERLTLVEVSVDA